MTGDQVWLRREGLRQLKSGRQITVLASRTSGTGDEVVAEVQIERFYPRTGTYRRSWIKTTMLLRDYELKHEQETLV
jgi:hypothetical protein